MTKEKSEETLPGTLHDFGCLAILAFRLSAASAGQAGSGRRLEYASHIFTAVCLTADALLKTHPESGPWSNAAPHVWNPVATATLARVLMEAAINLHYFCVDEIEEDEREFRFLIADLHCVRERLYMSDCIRAERDSFAPRIGQEIHPEGQRLREQADVFRANLHNQVHALITRLRANAHFQSLGEKNRRKWEEGDFSNAGRYRGKGFALEFRERAERACLASSVYDAEYRHLSSYLHSAPSAIDQIAGFGSDPAAMQDMVVPTLIRSCCGYLAIAIRYFLSLFPECTRLVDADACQLIDVCTTFAVGPVWLFQDQMEEATADE